MTREDKRVHAILGTGQERFERSAALRVLPSLGLRAGRLRVPVGRLGEVKP